MNLINANSNEIEEINQVFSDGKKLKALQKMMIFEIVKDKATITSIEVIEKLNKSGLDINVSYRHINRFRKKHSISRNKGRPPKVRKEVENPVKPNNISHVGVHIFDELIEDNNFFSEFIMYLKECIERYKEEHPGKDFRLLHHKEETLLSQFKALLYAPFFDIGKLVEYDQKEHPLKSLLGKGYHSSTLNQFLGQLEKINASESIKRSLIPKKPGEIAYVDGVLFAYWTKLSMHKGYITMLGRIMAGSQAVITHNEEGYALYFSYYPPDKNLSPLILDYCKEVSKQTGIGTFVVDRAVNSLENAISFEKEMLCLLCMLDKNEYKGLSDFNLKEIGHLEDKDTVYEGTWKNVNKREKDSRIFVIVEESSRILVYWGNPRLKEVLPALRWPEVYRERTELQENSFKRMTAHGKLKINFGTKKIAVKDRHNERKIEKVVKKVNLIQTKMLKKDNLIEEQEKKVNESEEKGHNKLLEKREANLKTYLGEKKELEKRKEEFEEKINDLEIDKQRDDRDFRKQSFMSFRTLFLENMLLFFLTALLPNLSQKISLDLLIILFFKRSGSYIETSSEIIYLINTDGLSLSKERKLLEIVEGITKMGIKCRGKPIKVRLKK